MWDWLGKSADIASLVSLLVSAYAAWQITAVRRKVSRRISFNLQADEFLPELERAVERAKALLQEEPVDWREAELGLLRCLARIKRTKPALSGEIADVIKRLEQGEKECRKLKLAPGQDGGNSDLAEVLWSLVQDIAIYIDGARDLMRERRLGGGDDAG